MENEPLALRDSPVRYPRPVVPQPRPGPIRPVFVKSVIVWLALAASLFCALASGMWVNGRWVGQEWFIKAVFCLGVGIVIAAVPIKNHRTRK